MGLISLVLTDQYYLVLLVLRYVADRLDWPSCFKIIQGIAQGLHDLHKRRIFYMDLNPENILVHSDMNTVIADSRYSVVMDGDYDTITRDDITGTP